MRHLIYISLILPIGISGCISLYNYINPYYKKLPPASVKSDYDKFNQTWSYSTTENAVYRSPGHSIYSDASYVCLNGENCKPSTVAINFTSLSVDWHFLDIRQLTFLINSEPYDAIPDHTGSVMPDATVMEQMIVLIDFELFKKIAFHQKVEARLGIHELDLNYKTREIYRLLVNSIENPGV